MKLASKFVLVDSAKPAPQMQSSAGVHWCPLQISHLELFLLPGLGHRPGIRTCRSHRAGVWMPRPAATLDAAFHGKPTVLSVSWAARVCLCLRWRRRAAAQGVTSPSTGVARSVRGFEHGGTKPHRTRLVRRKAAPAQLAPRVSAASPRTMRSAQGRTGTRVGGASSLATALPLPQDGLPFPSLAFFAAALNEHGQSGRIRKNLNESGRILTNPDESK